jgi:aryl-alcohol dehydrogenase-like predicted oxidoreductase
VATPPVFLRWSVTDETVAINETSSTVLLCEDRPTERPYVFTKCSLLDDGTGRVRHSLKRDSILREAEASLEEGWAALATLKERGLVRHISVSNFDPGQLRRIRTIAPVETTSVSSCTPRWVRAC